MNALEAHPFPPVWNKRSRILILGSFPSVRSRETGFYYGHPQNRFWPLLAQLHDEALPESVDNKKKLCPPPRNRFMGCDRKLSDQRKQRQQYPQSKAK